MCLSDLNIHHTDVRLYFFSYLSELVSLYTVALTGLSLKQVVNQFRAPTLSIDVSLIT